MLNKLITSHSSSDGDKLQASNSEVHNRKARNCRGRGGVIECTELTHEMGVTEEMLSILGTAHAVDVPVLSHGGYCREKLM